MRIAKYLASCGVASRRKSEELIEAGKVHVNGEKITSPALNVEPTDKITIGGKEISPNVKVYYALNKPKGYVSTTTDIHKEKIVTELVPSEPPVWPVGRLDKDTTGLIILTNDGELTQKLSHPSKGKTKEYVVIVDRPLSVFDQEKLKKGIELEDGPFKPDVFTEKSPGKYKIVIHEGRNRLIRRVFEHLGKAVTGLSRVRVASVELGNLESGKYRNLTNNELGRLRNA